jgi:hypothetical protein
MMKVKCGRCSTIDEFDSGFCMHCGFYITPAGNHEAIGARQIPDLEDENGMAKYFYDTFWGKDRMNAIDKVPWEEIEEDERTRFVETMKEVVCERVTKERLDSIKLEPAATQLDFDLDMPVIEHSVTYPKKVQTCYGCGKQASFGSQLCKTCGLSGV